MLLQMKINHQTLPLLNIPPSQHLWADKTSRNKYAAPLVAETVAALSSVEVRCSTVEEASVLR
jgi:hypothetical protein